MRTCQLTKEEFYALSSKASEELYKVVSQFMDAGVKIELKHVKDSEHGERYHGVCTRVDPLDPTKVDTYEMIYNVPHYVDDAAV
ncbi:hypothetical protein [Burkholderia phage FLC9]|nr:hypothetical protein [Burkholderia phage FLC9]